MDEEPPSSRLGRLTAAAEKFKQNHSAGKSVGSALFYLAPCRLFISRICPNQAQRASHLTSISSHLTPPHHHHHHHHTTTTRHPSALTLP